MTKLTNASCSPLQRIIEEARQALTSTLIVYEDGDDEMGDMAKLIGHVHTLLDQAENSAKASRQQYEKLRELAQLLKVQRDEAIEERDCAILAHRDAYLEGLVTAEEARLNTDWDSFGVSKTFSLDWLEELLTLAGEENAANAVAQVQRTLRTSHSKAAVHLLNLRSKDDAETEIPF